VLSIVAYLDDSASYYSGKFIYSIGIFVTKRYVPNMIKFYNEILRKLCGISYQRNEAKFSVLIKMIKDSLGYVDSSILRKLLSEFSKKITNCVCLAYVFHGVNQKYIARKYVKDMIDLIMDLEKREIVKKILQRDRAVLKTLAKIAGIPTRYLIPDSRVMFIATVFLTLNANKVVLDKNFVPCKKEYQLYAICKLLGINVEIEDSLKAMGLQAADFLAGILKHADVSWGTLVLRANGFKLVILHSST